MARRPRIAAPLYTSMPEQPRQDGEGRHETPLERVDRNTIELLNELRVAGSGIQVLFAFLLIVPFNAGYKRLTSFDRYAYFVTLLCIAVAAASLIAPSIQFRILFSRHEKPYLVALANRMAIVGAVFLAVGFVGILVLISKVVFGALTAIIVGSVSGLGLGGLWFALPLRRRTHPTGLTATDLENNPFRTTPSG